MNENLYFSKCFTTGEKFTDRSVTFEVIARRAELIWEERGFPPNEDLEVWLEAEAQLRATARGELRHPCLRSEH